MNKTSSFLKAAAYAMAFSAVAACSGPKDSATILMPRLSVPWSESARILGDSVPGKTFYSDFLLIQDKGSPARWHAVGIHKDMSTLYHAVADSLFGEWKLQSDIVSADSVVRMWAPFAVWSPKGDSAYMYYHHGMGPDGGDMWNSMRVLAAAGPGLDRWTKYDVYQEQAPVPGVRNIVFTGAVPRDACIFFDDSLGKYVMYYAENEPHAILARTSDDAVRWSEPVQVMGTPDPQEAFVTPESPFVIRRDGLYYLFVSGFDYARVALYVSDDPFDFGDPVANKAGEINGHAPEIVEENGRYYIACAHIASEPGMAPGAADLWGTYLQELVWTPATEAESERIFRSKKGAPGSESPERPSK